MPSYQDCRYLDALPDDKELFGLRAACGGQLVNKALLGTLLLRCLICSANHVCSPNITTEPRSKGAGRKRGATSPQSSSSKRQRKKKSGLDDIFVILVGNEGERFEVQRSLLVKHSLFFRAACSKKFKEGHEKVIRLLEQDPGLFTVYTQWTMKGERAIMDRWRLDRDLEVWDNAHIRQLTAVKLYVMADFPSDEVLKNAVIDNFILTLWMERVLPTIEAITHLYEHTAGKCHMRRVMVDDYVNSASRSRELIKDLEGDRSSFPQDFWVDVALQCARELEKRPEGNTSRPTLGSECDYHEHRPDLPKCRRASE